jgi:hypothetical protein
MQASDFAKLSAFTIREGATDQTMSWMLSDTDGKAASFQVDAGGLALVFQSLLGLLEQIGSAAPKDAPDQPVAALPAHKLSITPGRNPKEVALHVHIGHVDLAYLVPLDSVVITLGELVSKLYPDPPNPLPTH